MEIEDNSDSKYLSEKEKWLIIIKHKYDKLIY